MEHPIDFWADLIFQCQNQCTISFCQKIVVVMNNTLSYNFGPVRTSLKSICNYLSHDYALFWGVKSIIVLIMLVVLLDSSQRFKSNDGSNECLCIPLSTWIVWFPFVNATTGINTGTLDGFRKIARCFHVNVCFCEIYLVSHVLVYSSGAFAVPDFLLLS